MKPGFKPVKFTRKEWQDNRDTALKASGVGAALDLWQRHCPKDISTLDAARGTMAMKVCAALLGALKKAEDKCKSPALVNDKKGIALYRTTVLRYQKNLAIVKLRSIMFTRITKDLNATYEAIKKDSRLKEIVAAVASKALCEDTFHAWLLWKEQKYAVAVTKYGRNNDYNVADEHNKILVSALIDKKITTEVQAKFKAAIEAVGKELDQMMRGGILSMAQSQGEPFRNALSKYLEEKYPALR